MKISHLIFCALSITISLKGMQDQPLPGLQFKGQDGKIYDICQTTGIAMRSVPCEEMGKLNQLTHKPVPGMVEALYEQINRSGLLKS